MDDKKDHTGSSGIDNDGLKVGKWFNILSYSSIQGYFSALQAKYQITSYKGCW